MRFLGRRVYVGAIVIIASIVALALTAAKSARRVTGVTGRTTRRWIRWWRGPFVGTPVFVEIAARVIGVDRRRLPASSVSQRASARPMSTASKAQAPPGAWQARERTSPRVPAVLG